MMHEGFTIANHLNGKGYNIFVLKYRLNIGGRYPRDYEYAASLDLIRAVEFIRGHAAGLQVDPEHYSLWGGSAGARTCNDATYGEGGIKKSETLRPDVTVIAYTFFEGSAKFLSSDPPAYMIVGTRDPIVNWRDVERRAKEMIRAGIDVEYHILKGMGHDFSLAIGTGAEGWVDQAAAFWEKHMR